LIEYSGAIRKRRQPEKPVPGGWKEDSTTNLPDTTQARKKGPFKLLGCRRLGKRFDQVGIFKGMTGVSKKETFSCCRGMRGGKNFPKVSSPSGRPGKRFPLRDTLVYTLEGASRLLGLRKKFSAVAKTASALC